MRIGFFFAGVRFTTARDETFATFFRGGAARRATLRAGVLPLAFGFVVFVAFRARAFPAGERLVAGFKRVDFATVRFRADERTERRDDPRGESFFTLLATELMAMASAMYIYKRNQLKNDGRA